MAANRIHLIGTGRIDEDRASAGVTPGHLIELHNSTGRKVRVHATEGGLAETTFALEDALQGKEIDDAYVATDLVTYVLAKKGDVVYAFIQAAQNLVPGDKLISGGDGTLIKDGTEATATTVRQVLAQAEEALDLTATGAVAARVAVRIL